MDEAAADDLLEELSVEGHLGAFRTPLLASLVAAARCESSPNAERTAGEKRGRLFRRVVGDGLLGAWECQRSPHLVSPVSETTIYVLAAAAAVMLRTGARSFRADRLERLNGMPPSEEVKAALALGDSSGILRSERLDLAFAHDSIRDYFAAEYLLRAPPRMVALAWRSPPWRNALILFASLWAGDAARMWWLRLCASLSLMKLTTLRIMPLRAASETFYFMLDFAAESGPGCRWLQTSLFQKYRAGQLHISSEAEVRHRDFLSPWESRIAHVYRLFGRMDDEEIRAWLRSDTPTGAAGQLRYRVHGIRQDKSFEGVECLLASIGSDGDGLADDVAMQLAFEYPRDLLKPAFQCVATGTERLAHLLRVMVKSASSQQFGRERIGRTLRSDHFWRDFLVDCALHESDEVHRSAISALGLHSGETWIRKDAEQLLVDALATGPPPQRRRAAWALVMARSDESLRALEHALQVDEDKKVCLSAVEALLFRNPEVGQTHLLTWLRRWGTVYRAQLDANMPTIWSLVRTWSSAGPCRSRYKKHVRWFGLFAFAAADPETRLVAAKGLNGFRGPEIAEALHRLFEIESYRSIRSWLAETWGRHPESDMSAVADTLLEDDQPDIRAKTGWLVWQQLDRPPESLVEKLQRHSVEDPDSWVRSEHERYLRLIDVHAARLKKRERATA
jgi:hypothetical protein